MHRRLPTLAVAVGCALALIACSANTDTSDTNAVSGFPMTFENCGQQVTINKPPERALLVDRYAAPSLEAVAAIDEVVAKVGKLPPELYTESTRAALERIPTIGVTSGSGVQVSREATLAQNPDVVIGYEPEGSGITREALARSGIPFINSFVADCPNPAPLYQNASFEAVYDAESAGGGTAPRRSLLHRAVRGVRSNASSLPVPSPSKPITCCWTSRPTTSTSATSTRSSSSSGPSGSQPSSCCTI